MHEAVVLKAIISLFEEISAMGQILFALLVSDEKLPFLCEMNRANKPGDVSNQLVNRL